MGGLAFAKLGIPTPRLAPAVYQTLRAACLENLREHFVYVASPIEGAGKEDHGDIDVLVAVEKRVAFPAFSDNGIPTPPRDLFKLIKQALNAKHVIESGTSANLAIPQLSSLADDIQESSGIVKERFTQVDVRICRDFDDLSWMLFKHAHGDLWNIIGSTIRRFGLTVDEDALWLRIPEIEPYNHRLSKIKLTSEPVEILHFLGMKVEGFWTEPFASTEALFEYATTCRLFWVQDIMQNIGVVGGDEVRALLKHNDRRRMNVRPLFAQWINEYVPALRAKGKFAPKGLKESIDDVRSVVRNEAFARFHVDAEYKERLREFVRTQEGHEIKNLIKSQLPDDLDPMYRGCLLSALKKIVIEGNEDFGISPTTALKDEHGLYDRKATQIFVTENWEDLGRIAWSRQQEEWLRRRKEKEANCNKGIREGAPMHKAITEDADEPSSLGRTTAT
ncbi:hypothetical protein B0H63DRAFT_52418 [Podospora didyma]|uniref:Nucleotidyltransferase n=1 Tax=Podospora didyma TaxID=330526 RepID=A0AAE0P7V8_9PEZI|nr:hypothetical protein B0H63DRAFT_52418 [Podospora didyma]